MPVTPAGLVPPPAAVSSSDVSDAPPTALDKDGFCPECGAKTKRGWQFCMACGTDLMAAVNAMRLAQAAGNGAVQSVATPMAARTVAVQELEEGWSNVATLGDASSLGSGFAWDKGDAEYDPDDIPTAVCSDEAEDDDAPTLVFQEEGLPACTLTRSSTGEEYRLSLPATLGRGVSATVRILGNPYIGRIHARITEDDGCVLVRDEGSANRTYVNGTALQPYEDARLFEGDVLTLAREDFKVAIGQPVGR